MGRRYYGRYYMGGFSVPKPNYSKLINDNDKAKLLLARDKDFKDFVENWDKDNPNLLGWTLGDFYTAYMSGQPSLF